LRLMIGSQVRSEKQIASEYLLDHVKAAKQEQMKHYLTRDSI
jgi:hypothetical protein